METDEDLEENATCETTEGTLPPTRRRRLKQPTLSVAAPGGGPSINPREINIETNLHPGWIEQLLLYFEFISKEHTTSKPDLTKYKMQCQLCFNSSKKKIIVTDKCAYGFTRHLKKSHPDVLKDFLKEKEKKKNKELPEPAVPPVPATGQHSSGGIPRYARNDPRQVLFNKDMVNFVVQDLVPFTVSEGAGFQSLIRNRDSRLNIPSARTIERGVRKEYRFTKKGFHDAILKLPAASGHLVMDIWTSDQGMSIMGFQIQYVEAWQIRLLVLGFKHFPLNHSGLNIKRLMDDFLRNEMEILPSQIGSVTTDNASNMLAAFKVTSPATGLVPCNVSIPANEEDVIEDDAEDLTEEEKTEESRIASEDSAHSELVDSPDETEIQSVISGVELWKESAIPRNHCLAHLLQLAIKDSLNASPLVLDIVKKVNSVVAFFQKSCHWKNALKNKSKNLILLRPCATRWNALFYALQRILKTDGVNMIECVNETLCEARDSGTRRLGVPERLFTDDVEDMRAIYRVLEPLATYTNELQKDGVTSSGVIFGLFTAIKSLTPLEFDRAKCHEDELLSFKKSVLDNLKYRFAAVAPDVDVERHNRKVSVNVLRSKTYILSTLLDNRIKILAFDSSVAEGTGLENKLPSKTEAVAMLKEECCAVFEGNLLDELGPDGQSSASIEEEVEVIGAPPPKKPKGMLVWLNELQTANAGSNLMDDNVTSEVDDYLKMRFDDAETNPLSFWRKNESRLPNLAKLARIYLGIPASSASIERVFSVVKSLGKARNARMTPETVERLLCCNYMKR